MKERYMKDLLDIRKDIDKIDEQIVKLYEERMKLTSDVAEYKINTGKQVFDKEREESKLATLQKKAESDFTRHGIRELFEQIMAMSRKKQYKLLTEHGIMPPQEFEPIHTLDYSNARIVFQGLEGAYSQLAMEQFFGENCNNFHVESWKDAMEAIKNGEADYAVLPIENSSAGIVSENYDLLVEYDNYIVGEQIIRIDHALLGLEDADERDIRTVYSHKQSLMQCSEFLDSHADWEKFSVSNNAVAAKKVKEDGEISQAAIASAKNAQIYGLKVLRNSIQNNNVGFFAVLGGGVLDMEGKSSAAHADDAGLQHLGRQLLAAHPIQFLLRHRPGRLQPLILKIIFDDHRVHETAVRYRHALDSHDLAADAGVSGHADKAGRLSHFLAHLHFVTNGYQRP